MTAEWRRFRRSQRRHCKWGARVFAYFFCGFLAPDFLAEPPDDFFAVLRQRDFAFFDFLPFLAGAD